MFALIITIISIALVAALAIASIYYGGTAFTSGSAQAQASTIVNQAQQISAGTTLYENDNGGSAPASITALTPTYLQAIPTPPTSASGPYALGTNATSITVGVTSTNVCLSIVQSVAPGVSAISGTATAGRQYDCFGTAAPYTFQYLQ
ncbi:hypothetical protein [Thiomonas sp.]